MGVPSISVLLPYRNAATTIEQAIVGLLVDRELEPDAVEVIAIDDGSADDGPERVGRLAAQDDRVVRCASRGSGIVGALQTGLAVARGSMVARMDADDVALPGRLSHQRDLLASDARLAVVGTQVAAFSDDGPIGEGLARYLQWQNAIITPADHAREMFVESPLCHPSAMLRRQALDAVGGWLDPKWAEDYDLWLRLHAAGFCFAKVPEVLLRWRHRAGRLTFDDPRYAIGRFLEAKGHYLAPRLAARGRPVAIWGAGRTGRLLARSLEQAGVTAELFVDIDPRKIGNRARGAPIVAPSDLQRGTHTVVVAVGARGARQVVRAALDVRGFVETEDYVCSA